MIEEQMENGHALAVGDLNRDGDDEIVSGFRGKGCQLSIYQAKDAHGERWQKTILDDGGMAAADCLIEDFTAMESRTLSASEPPPVNVKLYENLGR